MTVIPIKVEAYSGYKAGERPTAIIIRDRKIRVIETLDRWYGEDHEYFKLKAEDGYTYLIRHAIDDEWELVMMEKGSP